MVLNILIMILGGVAGWCAGGLVSMYNHYNRAGKGTYYIEDLEDEPGFGKFHADISPESLSADTDKIILYRDKSH